jgi:membrane protein involved in colicin uptake
MTDWKAIAQTHNDSLVARIAENERLTKQITYYRDMWMAQMAENERLKRLLGERIRVEESALSAESATHNERWKSKP